MFFGDVLVPRILRDTAETGSLVPRVQISDNFCNSTPAPQVTVDESMPQILKDVGLSPLGPISERICQQNADDPIPRVAVDVPVPQDLKEVAEAVKLAENAPMPKTLKEKR